MSDPDLTPAEEQVRRLLADARHDEPMPDDVAERLDRVLADLHDEAPHAVPHPPSTSPPGVDGVRRATCSSRPRPSSCSASAISQIDLGGQEVRRHTGSADSSAAEPAPPEGRRRRRRRRPAPRPAPPVVLTLRPASTGEVRPLVADARWQRTSATLADGRSPARPRTSCATTRPGARASGSASSTTGSPAYWCCGPAVRGPPRRRPLPLRRPRAVTRSVTVPVG